MSAKIFQAITSMMKEVEPITKSKQNKQQNFMYRGIDDMYNELQPLFVKHGVFITSEVLESEREERQSKSGGLNIWSILKVKFTFYAEDGSNVNSIMKGEAMDSGDKGTNKAMSIALKYCLMQLLLIPTEELKHDDPDATSTQILAKTKTETKKTETKKQPYKKEPVNSTSQPIVTDFVYTSEMKKELETLLKSSHYKDGDQVHTNTKKYIDDVTGMTPELFKRIKEGLTAARQKADKKAA